MQVEGHTDNIPINTYLYPSNWELSTARANSVLKLLLDVGLGPSLIFRESWKKRFAELVDDEEGFWVESDEFLSGYQYKWLIGGNLELQYEFATNWHAYWAVVPAINILVINSMGVKYSF